MTSFSQEVRKRGRDRCILASPDDPCDGPCQAHHLIPKQRIKHLPRTFFGLGSSRGDQKKSKQLKKAMIADPRNGVCLCHKHHGLVTTRMRFIPPELVPGAALAFAREYGLEWALDAEIPGLGLSTMPGVSGKPRTGKTSRRKGKRGELEVVHRFHEYGFTEARRSGDAGQADGDLSGVPDYTEIRRRERLSISSWVKECREESRGRPWALVFRRNDEPWSVVIDLDHYLDLLARAESG